MNEKLEERVVEYINGRLNRIKFDETIQDFTTFDACDLAEYFYNLALEEVRKEVKMKYDCIDDIVIDWDDGYETACKEILNFIDNLTK